MVLALLLWSMTFYTLCTFGKVYDRDDSRTDERTEKTGEWITGIIFCFMFLVQKRKQHQLGVYCYLGLNFIKGCLNSHWYYYFDITPVTKNYLPAVMIFIKKGSQYAFKVSSYVVDHPNLFILSKHSMKEWVNLVDPPSTCCELFQNSLLELRDFKIIFCILIFCISIVDEM